MYPKKKLAQIVISACEYFNIKTVVVSPGSRNAPLTIGFHNHPKIEVLSIVDERCAGFFALGIAQQKQSPVALVCTSGSALLNYYPAIAEAFYSNIPIVIISADRPKYLQGIGDGQTINQENVFSNHVVKSVNLIEGELEININLLSNTFSSAINNKKPVHINVLFDEPLYEVVNKLKTYTFKKNIVSSRIEIKNDIKYEKLSNIWNLAKKKIILIGVNFYSIELQEQLNLIANDNSVLVMTETTSNLHNDKFINSIDKFISKLDDLELEKLKPDVLLTIGGMVISKQIKQILRKYQPNNHWHVDKYNKLNTFFCLTEFIKESPSVFFKKLNFKIKCNKEKISYRDKWLLKKENINNRHKKFLKKALYSDIKVFELVLSSIPKKSQLQVSNSSIIRYTQLFDLKKTIYVFCNRGTSGIDGSTSTAIGASYACKLQTIFITGDLSFFYDSNALWNNYIKKNFRLILINNYGGGIFKIIPGPSTTNALNLFEAPHNLTAKNLSKMFGFKYLSASTLKEVKKGLNKFYKKSKKPKILEIFTPSEKNNVVLQQYFKNL